MLEVIFSLPVWLSGGHLPAGFDVAQFEQTIGYTLENEGGFVDNRFDSGRATNMGITEATLSAYLGRQATVEDVRNMSLETAKAIYVMHYWHPLNLDAVASQPIATAIFDMGVNFGPLLAAEMAQEAVGVTVDGDIGPQSLTALNTADAKVFMRNFVAIVKAHYDHLVREIPKDRVFYVGWMRRADRLLTLV